MRISNMDGKISSGAVKVDQNKTHYCVIIYDDPSYGIYVKVVSEISQYNHELSAEVRELREAMCGEYRDVDMLPTWMKEKLAVLFILPRSVENVQGTFWQDVEGIGSYAGIESSTDDDEAVGDLQCFWVEAPY